MISIFVFSAFAGMAIAKSDKSTERVSITSNEDIADDRKGNSPNEINSIANKIKSEIGDKTDNIIALKNKVEEKVQVNKARYNLAKEKYDMAKEEMLRNKNKVKNKIEEFKNCKEKNSDECQDLKKSIMNGAKNHLLNTGNLIDNSMEKIRARIEDSNIEEEKKQELLVELDEKISELEDKKTEIELLSDDMTNQELQNAVKELKDLWQEIKQYEQKAIASLISSKTEEIVNKLDKDFVKQIDFKIDELAAKDIDTSELIDLLEKYKEKVAEANQIQAQIQEASNNGDIDKVREKTSELQEKIEEAKKELRMFTLRHRELLRNNQATIKEIIVDEEGSSPENIENDNYEEI